MKAIIPSSLHGISSHPIKSFIPHFCEVMVYGKAAIPRTPSAKFNSTPGPNAIKAFRLCKKCGRPTPQQEPICTHCGKRGYQVTVINVQEEVQEQTERRFVRAFFDRATPVAYGLFALNLLLYVLMVWKSPGYFVENLLRGVDERALFAFGAANHPTLVMGDWFRLLCSVFLHLSGLHVISNSFALAVVGPQVERLYGSARFLLIYMLAGLGGTMGSLFSHFLNGHREELALGASGAIFGLFGVLAVFGFKYRQELPKSFRQSFAVAVIPAIAVNLFIGLTVPFIDNAVHVGGLLTGVLLTFLIPYLAPGKEHVTRFNLGLLTACALVVFYCFGRAYFVNARPKAPTQQAQLNETTSIR